jgi:hypothetical protein
MMKLRKSIILIVLTIVFLAWPVVPAQAQSTQAPTTLVDDRGAKTFLFVPEVKLTSIGSQFGVLAGARLGLMMDHKFLIGVGGYGLATPEYIPMGYGGIVMEYLPWSDRVAHISFAGLVGAGGLYANSFFVAEPEVRLNVNVNKWLRLTAGGGYRFIGGAGCANSALRGPQATLGIGVGRW